MYTKLSNFKWNGKSVQVVMTDEYHRFKRASGNRKPEPAHVRKLRDSIESKELFTSIVVNEHWEVIDGQHRRSAFETLDRPVLVHVVPGLLAEDIKIYNVNMHNWKDDNYLNYYIELGVEDYVTYKKFQDDTGFNHGACRSLLTGYRASNKKAALADNQNNSRTVFKNGAFKVDADSLARAYVLAGMIKSLNFRHKRNQSFIGAFQSMHKWFTDNDPEYNHERMMHAFELYGRDYEQRPKGVFEFKMDLQKLYNHNRLAKSKVIFLTVDEMMEGTRAA